MQTQVSSVYLDLQNIQSMSDLFNATLDAKNVIKSSHAIGAPDVLALIKAFRKEDKESTAMVFTHTCDNRDILRDSLFNLKTSVPQAIQEQKQKRQLDTPGEIRIRVIFSKLRIVVLVVF